MRLPDVKHSDGRTVLEYNPPTECGLVRVETDGHWNNVDALQASCRRGDTLVALVYADGYREVRGGSGAN